VRQKSNPHVVHCRTLSIDLKFSDGTLQFFVFLAERVKRARFTYERENDWWVAYRSSLNQSAVSVSTASRQYSR